MTADVLFPLVDRIYAAADQPARWQDFLDELSEVLGGTAIVLGLQLPGFSVPARAWRVGLRREFMRDYSRRYPQGFPWLPMANQAVAAGFTFLGDFFPDPDLARHEFYLEWMRPQGLAQEGPLAHSFAVADGAHLAALAIFRRKGCRPINDADRRLCDRLAPHLAASFRLYQRFGGDQHEYLTLAEVVNRLSLGVVLVDREGCPVVTNRSADRLGALRDGFVLRDDGFHAQNPRDDAVLKTILDDAIAGGCGGIYASSLLAVSRPSGKRPFSVIISSLLEAGTGDVAEQAVASLLISDPDAANSLSQELLQNLYELTPAEATLVGLLADGQSLKGAAGLRGVTLNTVRSQLKQVFAKTDTNRQAQLIRLVLTGAGEFQEGDVH